MKKLILLILPLLLAGCWNKSTTKIQESNFDKTNINAVQEVINSNTNQTQFVSEEGKIKVILVLKFDSKEERYEEVLEQEKNQTVFDLLTIASIKHNFSLEFQNYPEMGVFIKEIKGIKNGTDNKYWQYTINGQYADKAADKMEIHKGDIVAWEFKESNFK